MSCHLYLGIAQIAITPPPALKRALWGTFFQARFYHFLPFLPFFTIFSLNKCPKPSGQGFRPPQNHGNVHLNLENSSLKKCPKPSGQGFRPPSPFGRDLKSQNFPDGRLKRAKTFRTKCVNCFRDICAKSA